MFQEINHLIWPNEGERVRGEINVKDFITLHNAHVGSGNRCCRKAGEFQGGSSFGGEGAINRAPTFTMVGRKIGPYGYSIVERMISRGAGWPVHSVNANAP